MKNKIRVLLTLLMSFFMTIGILSAPKSVSAAPGAIDKSPLMFDMDITLHDNSGHTHPGGSGQLPSQYEEMWKNLSITVTDKAGNVFPVENKFMTATSNGAVERPNSIERYGGSYAEGEELTVTVQIAGIPAGYHLPYQSGYSYTEGTAYNQFKVIYKKGTGDSTGHMKVRIPFGYMNVKFDPQGGTINGSKEAVTQRVKTDNTVDFPTDPVKENLTFKGWFTQFPTTYQGQPYPNGNGGKIYFWTANSRFSDYNRDWMLWNEPSVDPIYDNIFLLRAQYVASVTFDSNGGSAVDSATVVEGEKVKQPQNPTKKYAEFVGWQTPNQQDYNFESPVTQHLTLKAKWNNYVLPETKDITLTTGDAFDEKAGLTNQGKLPANTQIALKGSVDSTTPGTKPVTLIVTYPNGDQKEVTYQLTVLAKGAKINHAPMLKVQDIQVKQGDNVTLNSFVISAKDKEDGDLANAVEIIDQGGFDSNKAGTYTFTFKVTDKKGASATARATVKVQAKSQPNTNSGAGNTNIISSTNKRNTGHKSKNMITSSKKLPKTGYQTNKLSFALLLVLGGIGLTAYTHRQRKDEKY